MNFVATYDETFDKRPVFGAFGELCRLAVVEIIIGKVQKNLKNYEKKFALILIF